MSGAATGGGGVRRAALLAACALMLLPAVARPGPAAGGWRAARWGMTLGELLRAFPGEARALEPPERLVDGNVVAAGIEKVSVGEAAFRARFVLDPGGRLALVSLRTDPRTYAGVDVFRATRAALEAVHGRPAEESSDDAFVDMRQVTWRTELDRIDLKYLPGTVVILH